MFGNHINIKLYGKKRYYYLHILQVAIFCSVTFSFGIVIGDIFPTLNNLSLVYLFTLILIWSFILMYMRIKHGYGRDLDFLFNKKFYIFNQLISVLLLALFSGLFIILDLVTLTFDVVFFIYLHCISLLIVLINSIFILKSSFKD